MSATLTQDSFAIKKEVRLYPMVIGESRAEKKRKKEI